MGTFLCGLDDHEGYAARRLPDGRLTGTWTPQTADFGAYVAACSCSGPSTYTEWFGSTEHPPTDEGEHAAIDEWEQTHAGPLLAAARANARAAAARERTMMDVLGLLDTDGQPDASAIIARFWPTTGPHSPDTIFAAAVALDALLRYLGYATASEHALPSAPCLYRLVAEMHSALGRLDRVLELASRRANAMSGDPSLYDDRSAHHDPATTALQLAEGLDDAQVALAPLLEALGVANRAGAHLGHH